MSNEKPKQPASITQTMTNSPGGIQAGRDVVINQKPQVRSLNETELAHMEELLHPYGGQRLFLLKLGDEEANRFANQIERLFIKAAWDVVTFNVGEQRIVTTGPPVSLSGLVLFVPDPNALPSYARAIHSSFESTSTPVTIMDFSNLFPGSLRTQAKNGIVLRVGLKPLE
jgi:hypothetical protein